MNSTLFKSNFFTTKIENNQNKINSKFKQWSRHSLLLLTLIMSPTVWADKSYSNIFIFGDSLSDTGNLATVIGDFPNPPFFNNRTTNGLVAVEHVAASLNLNANASLHLVGLSAGSNYAVASARSAGSEPIDLTSQVGAFLANHSGSAPKDALYVFFIGGNDVFDASTISDPVLANQKVDDGVMVEGQQIQMLIHAGAKNFLVINIVDVSVTPAITLLAAAIGNPQLIQYAQDLTNRYNNKLKYTLDELKETNDEAYDIDIDRYNLYKTFNELLDNAADNGFTNTTNACFSTLTLSFNPGCNFGANFSSYIFFDEIHPTARVHKIIGELISKEIQ